LNAGAAPVKVDYFALQGGLDLVTPPLSIAPGFVREAQNYEVGVNGGYVRILGYERFDGRASPSDATYSMLPSTITGSVSVGNTVTGVTSSATGVVVAVEASALAVTKVTGVFDASEVLNVSGSPVATMTSVQIDGGASSSQLHAQYLNLAADQYRSSIGAVPGSGNVLGVWTYGGHVYAFRNASDGLSTKMYKSGAGGWTEVTTGVTLNPNGKYRFVNYNFGTGQIMFGCDGANKAFSFDGTTFTQITTGMAVDTPDHIAAHVNHLFLSFDNSLQHSAICNYTSWTPVLGAGELNMGDTVTNLLPQPGDADGAAMAVYTRNGTFMLYGTSSADWKLVTVQSDMGAFPYTAQYLGGTYVLDDRGVTNMQTTQAYGNFANAAVSSLIRPWVIENKARVVDSCVCKDKNQYRLFFNNGRAMYMTVTAGQNGNVHHFMPISYTHNMTCSVSAETSTGDEWMFCGDDTGYVFQMDRGTSFDGQEIESYAQLVFNHLKSPRTRKRYRKAAMEVGGSGYAQFWISADLGYASEDVNPISLTEYIAQLSSGRWDSGVWDVAVWDGRILLPAEVALTGTAENIALRIVQSSDYMQPLAFYGVLLHYSPRRQMR